jgi:hypothetical protein
LCPFPLSFGEAIDPSDKESGFSFAFSLALDTFRVATGVLLLVLALLSCGLISISSSSSISSSINGCDASSFFLADLVTGPKYPSCDASLVSEGVGEGDMTLGVPGTGFEKDRDILKGGRGEVRIAPAKRRPIIGSGSSQWSRFR